MVWATIINLYLSTKFSNQDFYCFTARYRYRIEKLDIENGQSVLLQIIHAHCIVVHYKDINTARVIKIDVYLFYVVPTRPSLRVRQ